jgi:hypothetical protein
LSSSVVAVPADHLLVAAVVVAVSQFDGWFLLAEGVPTTSLSELEVPPVQRRVRELLVMEETAVPHLSHSMEMS